MLVTTRLIPDPLMGCNFQSENFAVITQKSLRKRIKMIMYRSALGDVVGVGGTYKHFCI